MRVLDITASAGNATTQTSISRPSTAQAPKRFRTAHTKGVANDVLSSTTTMYTDKHKDRRLKHANGKASRQSVKQKNEYTTPGTPSKRQTTKKAVIRRQVSPPSSPYLEQPLRGNNRHPCPRKMSLNAYDSEESSDDKSQTTIVNEAFTKQQSPVPKPPTSSFTREQYNQIHRQLYAMYKSGSKYNTPDKYKLMMELADIALKLDINELAYHSADVPGMIVHYFKRICYGLIEDDEEYIIAQKSSAKDGPNLLERLRLLTGLHEVESTPFDVAVGQKKTPWARLHVVQKLFDDGQQFFNFENYMPQIQASLDRLAMTKDIDDQYDYLGDVVDIIDTIANQCKRRTLFDSKQAAFETYMYVIKATERCIRYKRERWDFSAVVDFTQAAILKLLDPDTMEDEDRIRWLMNPSLNRWLYLMSKQQGWHLPKMTRVVNHFHGMEDIFAQQLGVGPHRLSAQDRI